MSGASAQLAAVAGYCAIPEGRTPLAHLLHALNQPLTGLHCSLELALAGARSAEHYVRILRESLELAARMRLLVEAVSELAEQKPSPAGDMAPLLLDGLLLAAADELQPVAREKGGYLRVVTTVPLPVVADRGRMQTILFRVLASAVSLCEKDTELQAVAAPEQNGVCLIFSWTQGRPPDNSPYSRPELGLLLALAEWECAGGKWRVIQENATQVCTLRYPLLPFPTPAVADFGGQT